MDFDVHQSVLAVMAGGIVNTGVLVWVGATIMRLDREVTRLMVHVTYLRREVVYQSGRNWESEPNDRE